MENKDALSFFSKLSQDKSLNEKSVKLACVSDFSDMDSAFILNYTTSNSEILDLGSGTGLIINKISNKVKSITAVEPFVRFSNFIDQTNNVNIYNETINDFFNREIDHQYDIVTLFALMHYFNEEESYSIYKECLQILKPGGVVLIKNQFGITKDVVIEGYSQEQKMNYYAYYRSYNKEVDNLKKLGYKDIDVIDIYPQSCNRWDDTHFYAIVAYK